MALPNKVQEAIRYGNECWDDGSDPDECEMWQTIRAYLMSQDAELEMTRRVHRWNTDRCGENLMVCRDNHEKGEACDWETFVPIERAYAAESRLAAADALLRDIKDWDVLRSINTKREETLFAISYKLRTRIVVHLQGAGDEA